MFDVIAEPNRRRILDLLRDEERPVGDLVAALRLSQPAVSKHLRVLRDAGLVEVRADAQRRLYRTARSRCRRLTNGWRPIAASGATGSTHWRGISTRCPMKEKHDERDPTARDAHA